MKLSSIELDVCGESLRVAGAPESVVRYLLGLQAAVDELSQRLNTAMNRCEYCSTAGPSLCHACLGDREALQRLNPTEPHFVLRHSDGTLEVLR